MISLLIVEDEPIIAKDLAYTIEDLGYAVAASCSTYHAALDALRHSLPDLVLCDIDLGQREWDGIRLAQEIRRLYDLPIIFLTALSDSDTIQRAIAAAPEAYLAKPFEERSLYAAIELAISKFAAAKDPAPSFASLAPEPLPFIGGCFFIKDKKRLVKLRAEDILWVRADGAYSLIATPSQQHLVSTNLGAIEEKLRALPFMRVHRSHLVNFLHIEAIEEDFISIGTERIPLGKSHREEFYRRLQQL